MGSHDRKSPVSTKATHFAPPRGAVPSSANMTATLSQPVVPYSTSQASLGPRLDLPPLLPIDGRLLGSTTAIPKPLASPTISRSSSISWPASGRPRAPPSSTGPQHVASSNTFCENVPPHYIRPGLLDTYNDSSHGLKRHYDDTRTAGSYTPNQLPPIVSASSTTSPQQALPRSIATAPDPAYQIPRVPTNPPITGPKTRCRIHLRQHPRAARAGPDGKDRRTIDPPPVLQLLIDDFDLTNDQDKRLLRAHDWVVHAKLLSADLPHEDVSTVSGTPEASSDQNITRLLLGTTVSSPFFCSDDPDPDNAIRHPITKRSPPPSPSSRFLPKSRSQPATATDPEAYKSFPGTFFIFPDVSVRKAGQYRLEFKLMKMEPEVLTPGGIVPTISVVTSDVFNVVNAKDFDQVQPSTNLVKGLLDRGAGFPLKLKKGLREGQRRRRGDDSSDEADDEEYGVGDRRAFDDDDDG